MQTRRSLYRRHRFPPEIISHAVWLYYRFCLSFHDVEDLLAQRGVTVTYETIRQWCSKFGRDYAWRLRRREGRLGDTWHLDEVFVTIGVRRQYLWRAVDQEGAVLDILVQPRRDARAARRFFRKLLRGQGSEPARLVTDKLRSYGTARRAVMPTVPHDTRQYANNRAEVSHQPTRQRERQMRRFKSVHQAQRFLSVHGVIRNLFQFGRHLLRAVHLDGVQFCRTRRGQARGSVKGRGEVNSVTSKVSSNGPNACDSHPPCRGSFLDPAVRGAGVASLATV
jgi:putative transposase